MFRSIFQVLPKLLFLKVRDEEELRGKLAESDATVYSDANDARFSFFQKVKEDVFRLIQSTYKVYKSNLLYSVAVILVFSVLQPIIIDSFDQFWIEPVMEKFNPSLLFSLVYYIVCILFFLVNIQRRKLLLGDFLILFLYIKFRFFDDTWMFLSPFGDLWGGYIAYVDVIVYYYIILMYKNSIGFLEELSPAEVYESGYLYTDMSIDKRAKIERRPITEIDEEGLGRNKFAKQISDIVSRIKPFHAFAIGICGPWGAGKTSLIALIVENLKLETNRKYKFVEFSPWFFSSSEALIANFFLLLEKEFKSDRTLSDELKAYGKEIAATEKAIFRTEYSKLFFNGSKTLKQRYDIIAGKIKKQNSVLIITIDDLDRLDTREIVDVLRLVRLIADFPNTFYIVGYDRGYITSAITKELTTYRPDKYIDKVFNVEFKIPELSTSLVGERLKMMIGNQMQKLNEFLNPIADDELSRCCFYAGIDQFLKNERDVQRFSNNLLIKYMSIKEEVNFYHFFLLELIYFRDIFLYNAIYYNRDYLFDSLENFRKNPKDNQIEYPAVLELDESRFKGGVIPLLNEMFAVDVMKNEAFSIYKKIFFYRYFVLSLMANDFSDIDFVNSLGMGKDVIKAKFVEFNSINSSLFRIKLERLFSKEEVLISLDIYDVLEVLFFLYDHVYVNKSIGDNDSKLTAKSIGEIIYTFLANNNPELSIVEDVIGVIELSTYASLGGLFDFQTSKQLYATKNDRSAEDWKRFCLNIQFSFLEKEIVRINGMFNPSVLNLLAIISRFQERDEDEWYVNFLITRYSDYIDRHIDKVIASVLKGAKTGEKSYNMATIRELVGLMVYDIDNEAFSKRNLFLLQELNKGYVKDRAFSYVFQCPSYNGTIPLRNDTSFDDIIKFSEGTLFRIAIDPKNSTCWRFGIRLHDTSNIKETEERHDDHVPVLHLSKGQIGLNGQCSDDSPPNVDLAFYSGKKQEWVRRVIEGYKGGPIFVSFQRIAGGGISTTINGERIFLGDLALTMKIAKFRYAEISAWADGIPYFVEANVVCLKALPIIDT